MERGRTLNDVVIWVLDVFVAGVFLLVGIPKILGTDTVVLQAAAMHGFPDWIRVVVGVCEVIAAIALLVPRASAYAALTLAMLMIPATITQLMSGEPGVYVPVTLFVVLLLLAERRNPVGVRTVYRSIVDVPRPVLREGVVAGIIGATCVAVWFFVVDIIAGRPFFTPVELGRALLTVLRPTPAWATPAASVVVYTIFHYVAFAGVGIVAAVVAGWARREPSILFGFGILFVAFEVGFYGFVAVMQQASALGALAWYQVMLGNLVAAIGMGLYLWRAHPRIHEQFAHALDAPA